jgi:hypothetical protein
MSESPREMSSERKMGLTILATGIATDILSFEHSFVEMLKEERFPGVRFGFWHRHTRGSTRRG